MDPFMLFLAIGWGLAFFVAGTFAGITYVRLTINRESEKNWEAWAETKWKEAETLLEHLLEVTQGTASNLDSHREQFEAAVEGLSEAVAERQSAEADPAESSMAEAVFEKTQRLEQRLEQVMEMLEEDARRGSAETTSATGSQPVPSDNAPPSSATQVRERLDEANGDPKHRGRRQPRVAFEEMHEVAPVSDGVLPQRQDFLTVQCRDISSAGFSFYFPSEVDWNAIILRTCHKGTVREITADVVHCSRTAKSKAPAPFIVGCRFTGPLKRPEVNADSQRHDRKPDQSDTALAL